MNIAYQIESHAMILERWFSPEDALRRATESVKSGWCWLWPEPEQMELDL